MKKFMVLYMAKPADYEKMMKSSTPEQQKKGMDLWMKWMNKHQKSLVDGGAPLGKTKRVDAKGASSTKNGVGGYSIVQAQSHDAAVKLLGRTTLTCRCRERGWRSSRSCRSQGCRACSHAACEEITATMIRQQAGFKN